MTEAAWGCPLRSGERRVQRRLWFGWTTRLRGFQGSRRPKPPLGALLSGLMKPLTGVGWGQGPQGRGQGGGTETALACS